MLNLVDEIWIKFSLIFCCSREDNVDIQIRIYLIVGVDRH